MKRMIGKTINKCIESPAAIVKAYNPSSLKIDKPILEIAFVINPKTPIGANFIIT